MKKFYDMYLITIIKPEQLHETADAFERSILLQANRFSEQHSLYFFIVF